MKPEIRERIEIIQKGEVPEGYKKTKVGIIPDDWDLEKLSMFGDIVSGGTPDTEKKSYWGGDLVWVTPSDLSTLNRKFLFNSRKHITEKGLKNSSAKQLPKHSLIVCTRATIGTCVINEVECSTNQGFKNIILNNTDSIEYLYYQLQNNEINLKILSCGSTFLEISKTDFSKFLIPSPNVKEQLKIAEILSTWDKAIELKEKLIEEKKKFKRGLMQKLLTREIRFPEFTDEWRTAIIKDVFGEIKRINGNNSKSIDILTISAKNGFLSQKDKFNRVIAGSSLKKYTHLLQNEFAYNKGNSKTAPFGCIFKLDIKEGLVPFVYICFRPTQMIDVDFFDFYFKHGLLDRQLKRIITSGARSDGLLNVSKDNFFNMKISLPLIEEQRKIGFVLRLIQNEIDNSIAELNQLKEQKRGLMQLLLTGIVRVEVN